MEAQVQHARLATTLAGQHSIFERGIVKQGNYKRPTNAMSTFRLTGDVKQLA
jgi:hypothetical protein